MFCILLSTYNGEKYLGELLESISKLKDVEVRLLVRDDGSTDKTTTLLDLWKKKIQLEWYTGENLRSARSFLDLVEKSPEADYYAFCDQDDVWLPDKLSVAEKKLSSAKGPAMYFSQTQMVDADLKPLETPALTPSCNLQESITKSVVTGCTMVINIKLMDYLKMYKPSRVLMHDSWVYKLCMSLGGEVVYDPQSHILYRQHGNNVMGLKKDNKKEWKRRWRESIVNSERLRSKEVVAIVENYNDYLPDFNKKLLTMIADYPTNIRHKCGLLLSNTFRGDSVKDTLLLKLLVLTNKF